MRCCSLVDSKGRLDHQVIRETLAIKVRLEPPGYHLDHPEDQDQAGHQGLVDQEDQPWTNHPTPPRDLPMTHHRLRRPK